MTVMKAIDKQAKRQLLKAIMAGDRKTVSRLLDNHIPKGDECPLFWDRDADGNYIAGIYTLTPAEFEKLNDVYPCY